MFSKNEVADVCPMQVPVGEPLWEEKHSREKLEVLEAGDLYTFASQYQQNPSPLGGGMFKAKWWKHYDILPPDIDLRRIYGDTAQKTKEHNDYSVFQYWARSRSGGIYLIDQVRGKWEAPELEQQLKDFWAKHKPSMERPFGCQMVKIEDKSSGSSLIQSIKKQHRIPIEGIQRHVDKVFRAMSTVKYFQSGFVHLPRDTDWMLDYKSEFTKFTPMKSHKHDDQIDPTMDAVEDMLVFTDNIFTSDML